jgi:uncharacterized protein YbaR (Trm112 family)
MTLSPELLALLRCPESKEELVQISGDGDGRSFLLCPASRLRYPIDEHGIPVLLVEEAERLSAQECARLTEQAEKDPAASS